MTESSRKRRMNARLTLLAVSVLLAVGFAAPNLLYSEQTEIYIERGDNEGYWLKDAGDYWRYYYNWPRKTYRTGRFGVATGEYWTTDSGIIVNRPPGYVSTVRPQQPPKQPPRSDAGNNTMPLVPSPDGASGGDVRTSVDPSEGGPQPTQGLSGTQNSTGQRSGELCPAKVHAPGYCPPG